MHRHSAWTIPGVDPATQRAAEELAAQEGVTVGRLLQLLVAEHASSRLSHLEGCTLRQQLVPLFQQMVDAIGAAAQALAEPHTTASSAPPQLRSDAPDRAPPPSFEEIQDWLQRVDAKRTEGTKPLSAQSAHGRTALRRAG
jgi:hypothetical protein